MTTTHRQLDIDGTKVFVREAGRPELPAIVLLHGYPSSSHMFRDLIPLLSESFRVIAPDMVGFGHSDTPAPEAFAYTFEHLTEVTEKVLEKLGVKNYVLYAHDYGGPIAFRLAERHPERLKGLVIQNTNLYLEGVSEAVGKVFMPLWEKRTPASEAPAREFMSAAGTKMQYTAGAQAPEALDPDAWTFDQALLDRPGQDEIQLGLFVDYKNNVARYDQWQAVFKKLQPKTLILWGKGDPLFVPAGAEAYLRDLPKAELVFLNGSHFALEEHAPEISSRIVGAFGERSAAALAQAFYQELGQGHLDEALNLLAPDVSWNDPQGFPYGGKLVGPAAVRAQVFERMLADFSPFAVKVERVGALAEGRAVGVGTYQGAHAASKRSIEAPFVHLWTAAHGRLTRFETFTDTWAFHQALGR